MSDIILLQRHFFLKKRRFFAEKSGTRSKKGRSLVLFQLIHLGLQFFKLLLLPCKLFLPFRFRSVRSLLLHDAFGFLRAVCEFVHDGYAVHLAIQDDKKVDGKNKTEKANKSIVVELSIPSIPVFTTDKNSCALIIIEMKDCSRRIKILSRGVFLWQLEIILRSRRLPSYLRSLRAGIFILTARTRSIRIFIRRWASQIHIIRK